MLSAGPGRDGSATGSNDESVEKCENAGMLPTAKEAEVCRFRSVDERI